MRGILDAGFVFWGLFLVFALFVVAYLVWMARIEKENHSSTAESEPSDGDSS